MNNKVKIRIVSKLLSTLFILAFVYINYKLAYPKYPADLTERVSVCDVENVLSWNLILGLPDYVRGVHMINPLTGVVDSRYFESRYKKISDTIFFGCSYLISGDSLLRAKSLNVVLGVNKNVDFQLALYKKGVGHVWDPEKIVDLGIEERQLVSLPLEQESFPKTHLWGKDYDSVNFLFTSFDDKNKELVIRIYEVYLQ